MHIENKNNCTGCGACYNICPKSAISMKNDEYGFYKPVIDETNCVNCGLCEKVCPLGNRQSDNYTKPKAFAFQYGDKETLYKCASGGVFAALAKYIIEQDGIVYGVIYDESMIVCHFGADNPNDAEKMYSSKYVQSDTRDTFKRAKEDLQNGKTVLFSGTPCQIAGLKSYLQKDWENLITVDLVCHGVPSPLVFEKYKNELTEKLPENEKLLNIDFRSKVKGWSPSNVTIASTVGTADIPASNDDYMRIFLDNYNINDSCLNCKFNGFPRIADITTGDFWGVDKYDKSMNDNGGLSIVLLNSEKGRNYFEKITNDNFTKEVPLDTVVKYNPNLVISTTPHRNRECFFNDIISGQSLKFCVKKYCDGPWYIRLYRLLLPNFVKKFIKNKILKRK